jgi:VCBS repeat-containing protein
MPLPAPLTLPTEGVSPSFDPSSLQYYVRFTPAGGGTIVGETQDQTSSNPAYALDGFSFGAEQTLGIGSASSGAGAGKATFNPLQLSFDQPALNATLFQMLTSGTHLETVDVYGVQTSGDGVHFLVDYRFEFVLGKTLSFDQSGVTQLSLDYGQLLIRYLPQSVTNPDGTVAGETSFGWNQVENVVDPGSTISGDTTSPPVTTADTAAPAAVDQPAFPLVPGVDTSSLQYYVRFTRSDGTTLTVGGDQLFALDGFSFSAAQSLSIASASSGAGAGKVTFNPLHLSFDQPLLNPFLFQDEAMGVAFEEVDVLGYRAGKDTARLLIEYSFEPVIATTMGIDQSGVTQLDLEYGDEQIQYVNHRPLTVDDAANVLAGNSAAGDVLANDSDPDGDALTVSAVGGASGTPGALLAGTYGDLRLNGDGTYSYSADNAAAIAAAPLGGHPHDLFSYTASDGLGGTADASLDITIDRPPVAAPDTNGVLTAETISGNVLANDSDPDGDGLTVTAISAVGGASRTVSGLLAGTYGHLTLNAYGSYTYVADNAAAIAAAPTGSHPLDAFSYTISDGLGATSTATLDIVIDRSPIAANDLAGVQIGKSISGNVLANDRDLDGDSIRVVGLGGGSLGQSVAGKYGTLVLGPDGTYTYVSNKNAQMPSQGVAQDVFAYTESDGHGGTGQAMLSITTIPNGLNYIAGTPGAAITSGNGKTIVDASLGGQTVVAGNGADTIIGGPHDVLTGGNGPDTFVFGPSPGPNTITDFDPHNDLIQFNHALFASYAAVLGAESFDGHSTIITNPADPNQSVTLQSVAPSNLSARNFQFT